MAFRCRADAALRFEYVDEGSRRVTGYSEAELVDTGLVCLPDLIQPVVRDEARKQIQDGITRRGTFAVPLTIFTKDRTPAQGIIVGKGIFAGPLSLTAIEGYILRTEGVCEGDTTTLEGKPVQVPGDLWQRMLDHTGDIIAYINQDTTIQYVTPAITRVLGYEVNQILGKAFRTLLLPQEQARFIDICERYDTRGEGGTSFEFIAQDSSEKPVPITIRLFSTTSADESLILTASLSLEGSSDKSSSHHLMRTTCEASPVPLVMTRLSDKRIIAVNTHFMELTGKSESEKLIGLTMTAAGLMTSLDDLITLESVGETGKTFDGIETALRTKTGAIPVLVIARKSDIDDEPVLSWSIIPLPKKIQETKAPDVAAGNMGEMKEVYHRFKNDLQNFDSIIKMKGMHNTHDSVESALRENRAFLYALSAFYQKLSGDGVAAVCEYLKTIETNISDEYAERLVRITITSHCEGNWTMSAGNGIPIGIITTELLINCITHAFSPEESGTIDISFTWEEGWYILQIKDSGKGLPDEIAHGQITSTGLAIIENLALQLSGTAGFSNDGGAIVRVIFPDSDTGR